MLCSLFRALWFRMINGTMTFRFVVLTRIIITDIIKENTDKNNLIKKKMRLLTGWRREEIHGKDCGNRDSGFWQDDRE